MGKGQRGDNSAYASGMRGGEKPAAGRLDTLRIEVAQNGWTLSCSYAPKKKGGEVAYVAPGKPRVFGDLDELLDAVRAELEGKKDG